MTKQIVKIREIGLISLSSIIIFFLDFLPVFASYSPPPMKKQKPQRATISGSRGSCPDYSQTIEPLFPRTENLQTSLLQPIVLFRLNSALDNPLYFSLVDNDKTYPLYQKKIDNARSGLLAFQVPQNVKLEAERTYKLNFVVVCNEEKPSHNWSVSASIERIVIPPDSLPADSQTKIQKALLLSEAGLWFDALALLYQQDLVDDFHLERLLNNYRQKSHLLDPESE